MRLSEAVKRLCECGIENARHDAILIFEHFSGIERQRLYFEDVAVDSEELCRAIELRCQRHPLQYIIGRVGFYRESYEVTPDTLIPRQDTEILVDLAVKNIPDGESFVDLCTGSGCIAISVLNNTKNTRAVAVDLSTSAIEVAKRNAIKNGVADRVDFRISDVLTDEACGEFFAVLSNPPYVTENAYKALEPELYFEPRLALVADDEGLAFYKVIVKKYKNKIKKDGFILFEIGYDQGEAIRKIALNEGMCAEVIKDYSGCDRVALLRHGSTKE